MVLMTAAQYLERRRQIEAPSSYMDFHHSAALADEHGEYVVVLRDGSDFVATHWTLASERVRRPRAKLVRSGLCNESIERKTFFPSFG